MEPDLDPGLIRDLYAAARRLGIRETSALSWLTAPTWWWGDSSTPMDHLDEPDEIMRAFESHYGVEW